MKKTFLIFVIGYLAITTIGAQESTNEFIPKKNSIFLEAGGAAIFYSINYERNFSLADKHRMLLSGGFSAIPINSDANIVLSPAVGYLYGTKSMFEFSFAPVFILNDDVNFAFRIGYRRNWTKGLQFRAGLSPFFAVFFPPDPSDTTKSLLPWAYLSVGYSF